MNPKISEDCLVQFGGMSRRDELMGKLLSIRNDQLKVNELLLERALKVPVHLAIGHEAIALSVAETMAPFDQILLNHRNIHYQLALGVSLTQLVEEYQLSFTGVSQGKQGSMNLSVPKNKNVYTSNILGNNLGVALGVSQSMKIQKSDSVAWVVTGDGAIEEGSFYESLLCSRSWQLPLLVVVENNRWSLATEIGSRRIEIDLERFAKSLDVGYVHLAGNLLEDYILKLNAARDLAQSGRPVVVEVDLESLGGYFIEEASSTRYINYHAGAARIDSKGPIIKEDNSDPLFANGLAR